MEGAWQRGLALLASAAATAQAALLLAAPVTALAVASCAAATAVASVGLEMLLGAVGLPSDLSTARMVILLMGLALCVSIGPSTALLYHLLGRLANAPIPAVAQAARSLLAKDASCLAASHRRRQQSAGHLS